jgi:hypothetical protein
MFATVTNEAIIQSRHTFQQFTKIVEIVTHTFYLYYAEKNPHKF